MNPEPTEAASTGQANTPGKPAPPKVELKYDELEYFSALNGPAFLLYAVLLLREKGIPLETMRVTPNVGHFAQPEVIAARQDGSIDLNIRADNRLQWLYPLMQVGLPKTPAPILEEELRALAERLAASLWDTQFAPSLIPNRQEQACLETHRWLIDRSPDEWTEQLGFVAVQGLAAPDAPGAQGMVMPGAMSPTQWLARLWRTQYPELQSPPALQTPSDYILLLRDNRLIPVANPHGFVWDDQNVDTQTDAATRLAERFFTLMFLHLAEIDMLEGAAYPMDWSPPDWDLTVEDFFAATLTAFQTGESPEALGVNPLAYWLGRKSKPYAQNGLLGGLDLNGVLLRLMQDWKDDGFLGLMPEDWQLFSEPQAQGILWALLLKRREVTDWGALFDRAVRLLVSQDASIHLEAYHSVESRMGTPLAQLGLTLMLEGEAILRAPEVIVYLPHERFETSEPEEASEAAGGTEATEATVTAEATATAEQKAQAAGRPEVENAGAESKTEQAHKRLEVLGRLFLPAHVPLRCRWAVDAAVLGETAWLADGNAPRTREGLPLRSCLAK